MLSETHANYTEKWYTPKPWLSWAMKTLGGGFIDPCPSGWVEGTWLDGLNHPWGGHAYVNHPGSRGSAKVWWEKAVREMSLGNCEQLIWCAFSIEQLRHMDPSPLLMPGWLVMPRKRISFIDARTGEPGKQPSNWAVFWTSAEPAETPEPCVIIRTGVGT